METATPRKLLRHRAVSEITGFSQSTIARKVKAGANSWSHRPIQDVVIEPGQTATVDVSVEGSRVIGQLVLGEAAQIPGMQWFVGIASASRWKPNPSMSPEEVQKLVQDPEFQKAMQQLRHYQCNYRPDGTFDAEDIPAGSYDLTAVGYILKDGQPSQTWNGTKTFTVPEGSTPDSVLDLGAIPMSPAPVPVPGK